MLKQSPLGKRSPYISSYTPSLLYAIERQKKRQEIAVPSPLPFDGVDIWNAYELSWLNKKGKPQVAMAEFFVPCTSPRLIESKSFKLYLNSLNQTVCESPQHLHNMLQKDLAAAAGASVSVSLILPDQFQQIHFAECPGICLDDLDVHTNIYQVEPNFLQHEHEIVEETLYSNLLKSNCLVTGQPDWASINIHYAGPKINRQGLLKYIISFRDHNEFHEQCIERIFMDIWKRCKPSRLSVYGRYTRRGGLDINPFRSSFSAHPAFNTRTARQ